MPFGQDQIRRKVNKNFEPVLELKLDTAKEAYSDPMDIWQFCEDYKSISGKESEVGLEENVLCKKSHFKCVEDRHFCEPQKTVLRKSCVQQKNVRFDPTNYSSVDDTSVDHEYSDVEFEFIEKNPCHQYEHNKRRYCSVINSNERELQGDGKRSFVTDQEGRNDKITDDHYYQLEGCELTECRDCCGKHNKMKMRTMDYGYDGRTKSINLENSRRIVKEEFKPVVHRMRKLSPKGKHSHSKVCCDLQRHNGMHDYMRKPRSPCGAECEEKINRCGDWCKHCTPEESRDSRNLCEKRSQKSGSSITMMAPHTKQHKRIYHMKRDKTSEEEWKKSVDEDESSVLKTHIYQTVVHQAPKLDQECCYHTKDMCDHVFSSKQKKKVLDSYEELPVVDESQEHYTDATYNPSLPKCSNMNAADRVSNYPREKTGDKMKYTYNKSPSWFLYDDKVTGGPLSENLTYDIPPERTVKLRSRRTRRNRSRRDKWTKVFTHAVMGRCPNVVGFMVMGPNGPEYYTRPSCEKACYIPFRKTRSFPEGPTESYDMAIDEIESKDVFLTASDPGRKQSFPTNDLTSPEEDIKVDEKVAKYDETLSETVKDTEQKFLESLSKELPEESSSKTQEADTPKSSTPRKNEKKIETAEPRKKFPPFRPLESLGTKIPKSIHMIEKSTREGFSYSAESRSLADTMNEQVKQFRLNKMNQKEEIASKLDQLEQKFPPKPQDEKIVESNLSLWCMNVSESNVKELKESQKTGGEGDGNDSHRTSNHLVSGRKRADSGDHERGSHREMHLKEKNISETATTKTNEDVKQTRRKCCEESTPRSDKTQIIEEACSEAKNHERYSETESVKLSELLSKPNKWKESPRKREERPYEEPQSTKPETKAKEVHESEHACCDLYKDLIKNCFALSEAESINLNKLCKEARYEEESIAMDVMCSTSSEGQTEVQEIKKDCSPRYPKSRSQCEAASSKKSRIKDTEDCWTRDNEIARKYKNRLDREKQRENAWVVEKNKTEEEKNSGDSIPADGYLSDVSKKYSKSRHEKEEFTVMKLRRKLQNKSNDVKCKRRCCSAEEKMKLRREILPSLAAESEAAHLKQLKKFIHRFIDQAKLKTTSVTDVKSTKRHRKIKPRDSTSSDSSEVKVDARKIIELMSNPSKKITSDMKIDIAKKLTDALVQETASKSAPPTKERKHSDVVTEDDPCLPCTTTSGSDGGDDEPAYLKQLKKLRNDHISNIIMEARRLNDLLRFLDRSIRPKL